MNKGKFCSAHKIPPSGKRPLLIGCKLLYFAGQFVFENFTFDGGVQALYYYY